MKNLIKKYFQSFVFFYVRLRYRIFVRMGLSIGVGLMDGFGLAMFLPLLKMVDNAQVDPESLGNLAFLIKGLAALGISINLSSVLLVLSGFFLLKGLGLYINGSYEIANRQYFIKSMRVGLTKDMAQLSYKAFVMTDAGKIQNTLSGEVGRISQAYQSYFNTFQQAVLVIMYMCFAFFVDARFALLISLGGLLTNFLFRRIYVSTKKASGKLTKGSIVYQGLIIQYVANFKYLKASGTIKKFNQKLLQAIYNIEENNRKIGSLNTIITATREPLLILVVCAVIFIQVNLMGSALGTILISLLFFYRALTCLVLMQTYYNTFLSVSGSMENMSQMQAELKRNKEVTGKIELEKFSKDIQLKQAGFSYPGREILKNINLNIEKNQTVAFVGESGSGKTTLVNLLVGLMPLDKGKMLIDGIEAPTINIPSFQQRIGYITQEPVIFNDTIFNNVTFWDEPTPENRTRFNEALQKAAIYNFVYDLPAKENEKLGNNGINVSGGQKQRLSIARELYKDIDILVLDEATSALDSETEKEIQQNIDNLKGKYTILIVAHRLSTIKNAHKIVLLEDGAIKETGSYAELSNTSNKFKKMVALQEV